MREVGVLEAKTNLSALLDSVERTGEPVMITRHGKPVAQLSAPARPGLDQPRKLSGEDLVRKLKAMQARMLANNPELAELTTEDLKAMGRE